MLPEIKPHQVDIPVEDGDDIRVTIRQIIERPDKD
jgi:hypothetical protein